jgi:hypothetical protein
MTLRDTSWIDHCEHAVVDPAGAVLGADRQDDSGDQLLVCYQLPTEVAASS